MTKITAANVVVEPLPGNIITIKLQSGTTLTVEQTSDTACVTLVGTDGNDYILYGEETKYLPNNWVMQTPSAVVDEILEKLVSKHLNSKRTQFVLDNMDLVLGEFIYIHKISSEHEIDLCKKTAKKWRENIQPAAPASETLSYIEPLPLSAEDDF